MNARVTKDQAKQDVLVNLNACLPKLGEGEHVACAPTKKIGLLASATLGNICIYRPNGWGLRDTKPVIYAAKKFYSAYPFFFVAADDRFRKAYNEKNDDKIQTFKTVDAAIEFFTLNRVPGSKAREIRAGNGKPFPNAQTLNNQFFNLKKL